MIHPQRKKQISRFAEEIAQEFSNRNVTQLNDIAIFEDVTVHDDDYENAFDGMLIYDEEQLQFHIHIDNSGNKNESKRSRFTLAHELGHYFLDEHRLGLKYGLLEPHASFHNINQKLPIEEEADYFASCLLMPSNRFKTHSIEYKKKTGSKGFSFETIIDLAESFQTSIYATLIRFGEVGTHEIFAVVSKENIARGFVKSVDFPNWKWKFKIGESIPQSTLAGEYYNLNAKKYTSFENIDIEEWFIPPDEDNRAERQMYEQCFYADNFGYVISLMWFD